MTSSKALGATRNLTRQNTVRSSRANTLVFITALTLALLIAVAFFSLRYTRALRSSKENHSAIEQAALKAAEDISRIVVPDETFGYVALIDVPQGGKLTKASDNYYLPVRGINSLLATIRLDMIIADQLDNQEMKAMAEADLKAWQHTRENLAAAIRQSIAAGEQNLQDADGNIVHVLDDAIAAYEGAPGADRPPAARPQLVPESLKLSIGCAKGLSTNIVLPAPKSYASTTLQQQKDHRYRAYTNVAYDGKDFVFAAVAPSANLIDSARFRSSLPRLPYALPCVILAEADQTVPSAATGSKPEHVHACAQPGSQSINSPPPGRLTVSFPNGQLPEFSKPADLARNGQLLKIEAETSSPQGQDFPPAALKSTPLLDLTGNEHPTMHALWTRALYDWLRRAGSTVNVQSVIDMQQSPLAPGIDPVQATITSYSFVPSGLRAGCINYSVMSAASSYVAVSDGQVLGVSRSEFAARSGTTFDTTITDNCCRIGRSNSGIHGGEPIMDGRVKTNQILNKGNIIADASPAQPRYQFDFFRSGIGATIVGPPSKGWDGEGGGWAFGQWKQLPGVHGGSNKDVSPELQTRGPEEGAPRPLDEADALVADFAMHRIINADAEDE